MTDTSTIQQPESPLRLTRLASEPAPASSDCESADAAYEPSYSVRLIRPFLRVVRRSGIIPKEAYESLEAMDADERIPIASVHDMLQAAIDRAGDPDLGLKAAREYTRGDCGAIDYAVSSAATVRDAMETAGRYMRLINDSLEFRLEVRGEQVFARLENTVPLPRAAVDFQCGAFHRAHSHSWASDVDFEVRFQHAAPDDVTEYERTFGPCTLKFGASEMGFLFDRRLLDMPLPSADSKLHEVMRRHAEVMLNDLPRTRSLSDQVRELIAKELTSGNASVVRVASHLNVSSRTLERRLEREGTTFTYLLDDLRKRLALGYVGADHLDLSEVALLLGFSQTSAFHRAFKRWTNQTPLHFRRAHRQAT